MADIFVICFPISWNAVSIEDMQELGFDFFMCALVEIHLFAATT